MPVSERFAAFILEQLEAIGPIATKRVCGAGKRSTKRFSVPAAFLQDGDRLIA